MHRISTTIIGVATAAALAGSALAADRATGWKNWADQAERVAAAAETDDLAAVGTACKGSMSTIISQGFQFPYWAQMLPQFCDVYKTESRQRVTTVKGWRAECKLLDSRMDSLAKAEPVAEEPRAEPAAKRLAATLAGLKLRECSHRPERDRS